jgi:hypothetical protein
MKEVPNVGSSHTFLYQVPQGLIIGILHILKWLKEKVENLCYSTCRPLGLLCFEQDRHLMLRMPKECMQGCGLSCHSSWQKQAFPFYVKSSYICIKYGILSQRDNKICLYKLWPTSRFRVEAFVITKY